MPWVTIFRALVAAALSVARTIEREQLLDAGEARYARAMLALTQQRLTRAVEARESLRRHLERNPGKLRDDDGHRRD